MSEVSVIGAAGGDLIFGSTLQVPNQQPTTAGLWGRGCDLQYHDLLWFAAGKEIGWLYTLTAHSHIIQIFLWNRWRSRFCFRTAFLEMFLEAQGWSPGAITYLASGHIRELLGNNNETSPILWATDSPASIFCWHSLWPST